RSRPNHRRCITSPAGCCATPTTLDPDEQIKLKQIRAQCPHLDAVAGHVTTFAKMLIGRHGERLGDWITAVHADDLPELQSFATGLMRDHAAVLNGLPLPYSSGAVEGQFNRIPRSRPACSGWAPTGSTCTWRTRPIRRCRSRRRIPAPVDQWHA